MDKSKNNKAYIFAYVISFLIILALFSFFVYKKNIESKLNNQKEIVEINKLINNGKYKETIDKIDINIDNKNLTRDKKIKLLESYLNYGNYFYKEDEYSKKANEILDSMKEEFITLFYRGYSKEIIKDYSGALLYYNKGLELKDLQDNNKSILLNQIGHVYDLKGEFDKVFKYYDDSYKLDTKNPSASANLGRYYARINDFDKAKNYLKESIEITTNLPSKSEIAFSLSSIELELNGLKPDIEKSIQYAKMAIEYYPSYTMGYIALARGMYIKNDKKYYTEIEENLTKALELNPNSYHAYELKALKEYDLGNYDNSNKLLEEALKAIDYDTIFMDGEREYYKLKVNFLYYFLGEIKKKKANQNEIYFFFDEIIPVQMAKEMIKIQLKRNKGGILEFLEQGDKLETLKKNLYK